MERIQLTKEIINDDLKKKNKEYIFLIIATFVLICIGISDLLKNLNKEYIFLIIFPCLLILLGLACFTKALKKIMINNKYSIGEGIIEKTFYDQRSEVSKVTIKGLKGIIISSSSFLVGQSVYVVYNKSNALMCYDKNKYYV